MSAIWVLVIIAIVAYAAEKRRQAKGALDLPSQVRSLEQNVAELRSLVDELRGTRPEGAAAAQAAPPPERAHPSEHRLPSAPPREHPPERPARAAVGPSGTAAAAEATRPLMPPLPAEPRFDWGRTISIADLMGAKALAFAGGVVTLLGVVFFFVLAVNRGWIGPGMRVACGGGASAIVFAAGIWLRRRYETTYSALAAVGAGIAGGYATLLAAVSLYDLVSKPVALIIAAAIAMLAVVVALAWSSEIVSAFGLIGAMIVPATLVFQGGLQEIGTAFVAIVFAGAALVAVRQGWWTTLRVAALVSVPQALAQIAAAAAPHPGIVTLATVFWLLYLAAGLAHQLKLGRALAAGPASFLVGGAVFAGISTALLYDGVQQGVALLVVAAVYAALSAVLFRRASETATLIWALGLTVAAVGAAQALSGSSLTVAWAAEGALLAWLSTRVRDSRFQLPALAYLSLALLHGLAVEARPDHLFRVLRHPAAGAPALLAVALAAIVFAKLERSFADESPSRGILRKIDPILSWLRAHEAAINVAMWSLAATVTVYATSLAILELFQAVWAGNGSRTPFNWGEVAVTSGWSTAAVAAVIFVRRSRRQALALGWLGVTVIKVLAFDVPTLGHTPSGVSLLVVGAASLLAGLVREAAAAKELSLTGTFAIVVSLGLLLAGALVLVPEDVGGVDGNGLVLAAGGALYSLLGAGAFATRRQRDLSTLLWLLGFAAAAVGAGVLLDGVWLVLVYALTAAALAAISVAIEERRLQVASLAYLLLGAVPTLAHESPPSQLVMARLHPGHGLPSLLLEIGALAVLAWALGWNERHRLIAIWTAGALAVYGASLAILETAQRVSPGSVHTDFQRGQTAVSAFWGLLALVSLYAGLRRRTGLLRGGGFALFAISLGKIFLFDLPSLSSVQRALSFLAVGAVLLLGGFFYQRLSAQFDDRAAV